MGSPEGEGFGDREHAASEHTSATHDAILMGEHTAARDPSFASGRRRLATNRRAEKRGSGLCW
jgi:hypothetical protein